MRRGSDRQVLLAATTLAIVVIVTFRRSYEPHLKAAGLKSQRSHRALGSGALGQTVPEPHPSQM